jgi:hypothetical protein
MPNFTKPNAFLEYEKTFYKPIEGGLKEGRILPNIRKGLEKYTISVPEYLSISSSNKIAIRVCMTFDSIIPPLQGHSSQISSSSSSDLSSFLFKSQITMSQSKLGLFYRGVARSNIPISNDFELNEYPENLIWCSLEEFFEFVNNWSGEEFCKVVEAGVNNAQNTEVYAKKDYSIGEIISAEFLDPRSSSDFLYQLIRSDLEYPNVQEERKRDKDKMWSVFVAIEEIREGDALRQNFRPESKQPSKRLKIG